MELISTAFSDDGMIPKQYTCDGSGISPPLMWKDAPAHTQSFVLIMDDPDAPAGTWVHWIIFNIPKQVNELKENVPQIPPGARLGRNSWQKMEYGAPCPPSGSHRYFFKLYALDIPLTLPDGATKVDVEASMSGHILEKATLMGRYHR